LITYHADFSIRFQDISVQLLITHPDPIKHHFPYPLPALTIDLVFLLSDPLVASQLPPNFLDQASIDSVELSTESLECAVVFKSGEVVIYRLNTSGQADKAFREAEDKELTILEHLPRYQESRFYPYLMIATGKGPAVASAISDIGKLYLH
jgi:syntaxin-binding protein 5